ncbi:MAG: PAS domain-containing protein [Candidatus Eiseniibacteriota bacterium]
MGSIVRSDSLLPNALAYWHRLRGGRRLPLRADFDPSEVPTLLPYVLITDVLRDPQDFEYRLLGTALERVFGADFRGKRFSQMVHTKPGTPIWDEYCRVVAEEVPLRSTVGVLANDRAVHQGEHVLMPFSDGGDTVDMLMAVVAVTLRPAMPVVERRPRVPARLIPSR